MTLNEAALNDAKRLKKYIRKCSYISPGSGVIPAALRGIDQYILAEAGGDQSDCSSSSSSSTASHGHDDGYHENEALTIQSPKKQKTSRAPHGALRSILFYMPLVFLFAAYLFVLWIHRVHDLYLVPARNAMVWNEERQEKEATYYPRWCDEDDITTRNAHDLILNGSASTKDAYEHQLRHGFTVFPKVLSEETATELRQHVQERSKKLRPSESIFVLSSENRYSLALGTEVPAVANAMMELANNEQLSNALEAVMGKSPTTIEMSIITSSFGAVDQGWHRDVSENASAMRFARSFGSAHSVFIQLQDTTKEMGATQICPGTHVCSEGNTEGMCSREGFQFVGRDGVWRQGDALLMDMNSFHRGAAHTDPDSPDRVMLVLTFVPRPLSHSESRIMSLGTPCSQRWDMWGHTLKDLADARSSMRWPLRTFRALGLYKPKNAEWGIDFISGSLMRMANDEFGFKRSQLDTFIERDGGIQWLPQFLHGKVADDESWPEFILDTIQRCEMFGLIVNVVALIMYLFYLVFSWKSLAKTKETKPRNSLLRLAITHGAVYLLFMYGNHIVDKTDWAADIRAGRMYSLPFDDLEDDRDGPKVLPSPKDVLIESRYGSEYLAMYNDFVGSVQPGNMKWSTLSSQGVEIYGLYSGLPRNFRAEIAEYIVGSIENDHGRFLYQRTDDGIWVVMPFIDAVGHTLRELQIKSDPIRSRLRADIRNLSSECRFGNLRDTALSKKFTPKLLEGLKTRLVAGEPLAERNMSHVSGVETGSFSCQEGTSSSFFFRAFKLPVYKEMVVDVVDGGLELKKGDDVEGIYDDNGKIHLYRGRLEKVTSTGIHNILYADGDRDIRRKEWVRRFEPYVQNEAVEVNHNEEWQVCIIRSIGVDGMHTVVLLDDEDTILRNIESGRLRRRLRKSMMGQWLAQRPQHKRRNGKVKQLTK